MIGNGTTTGTLQMSGVFDRSLAATATAGSGTVTFSATTGGGGFAAHTTPLTVSIGGVGTPTALTWGSGGFAPTGSSLSFGSASALSDVTFVNAIDLGTANRTISVVDNANTGSDMATITGF